MEKSILEEKEAEVQQTMANPVEMDLRTPDDEKEQKAREKKEKKEAAAQEKAQKQYVKAPQPKKATHKIYFSKFLGLKIVIQPEDREYDPVRKRSRIIPGDKIKFVDGKYVTDNPEHIRFLEEEYMPAHQDEVFTVNKEHERLARAIKNIEQEDELSKEAGIREIAELHKSRRQQGRQGAVSTG